MKETRTFSLPLVISIVFAASVISGSLVFFGLQMQTSAMPVADANSSQIDSIMLAEQIDKGIERYIKEQTNKQQAVQRAERSANVTPPNDSDYIRGNENAEVTLIEYSDYECPFCKKFHPTAQKLVDKYDGKVNWIYRHFPLAFHDPLATNQALAAECAGEQGGSDAYWKYTDQIFEVTSSNGRGMTNDQLFDIAGKIGIDQDKLQTCVEEEKYKAKVASHITNGKTSGITGTPGNILYNNKTGKTTSVNGAQPLSALESAVEQLLSN